MLSYNLYNYRYHNIIGSVKKSIANCLDQLDRYIDHTNVTEEKTQHPPLVVRDANTGVPLGGANTLPAIAARVTTRGAGNVVV